MFGKLAGLFSSKDDLERVAGKGDLAALNACLKSRPVLVPQRPHRFLDAGNFTQDDLQELIKEAAEHAAKAPFEPWVLDLNGQKRLPVFSSQEKAENFSKKISTQLNQVFVLSTAELLVADVTDQVRVDFVELNLFSEKSWEIAVRKPAGS